MIPKILHQIWSGMDIIPEARAVILARNTKYANENGFSHFFWRLLPDGGLLLRNDGNIPNYSIMADFNILQNETFHLILADTKLHPVCKDILRFAILQKYGGFYADLDLEIFDIPEYLFQLDYVCGYEHPRNVVCTAFLGAPEDSPVHKSVIDFIVSAYDKMKREDSYPKNMWEVLDFIGPDMLTKILKNFPNIKPFPINTFFPFPQPIPGLRPFTRHDFAGSKKGGWVFEKCEKRECEKCEQRVNCNIVKEK
jgi:mannosyltransferase OCH1-like enzyme